ncbi:hypothetical protein [Spiroplasma endosymbiont of Virgichneumon dumeticola]|uniref:hypothetical protein n=1 Tax=Spiroplasma endosymbiont of Virgichneumon dumeticola TaxID=3139323 RepID=UPI0035C89431
MTQSLHQGEERHTFYSNNPIANNVNDFNELSVAQYRFNNSAFFTSNMFNWTTQYKTNHDEYEETEETTFSYPASILPPDPMNIAKQIVINLNLNANKIAYKPTISLNNFSNIKKPTNNTSKWLEFNQTMSETKNIDLKSLLDPTLLIYTINDLNRYYKSITIYYDYDIETEVYVQNQLTTKYSTQETFANPKTISTSKVINILDIIFSNQHEEYTTNKFWDTIIYGLPYYQAWANPYYDFDKSQYVLNSYQFKFSEDFIESYTTINSKVVSFEIINYFRSNNFRFYYKFKCDCVQKQ